MKKLQQFYIFKFDSLRLKNTNYNIQVSLDKARINGEVITINNSELVRTLFRIKNINFDQRHIDNLLIEKKKVKKYQNNENNRKKLQEIQKNLDKILFIKSLISIEFQNKSHYKAILNRKGFHVNGEKYVPFLASAGMVRRNTALFVEENLKNEFMIILENGRNKDTPLVPVKWGTYFSLYSSSTLPVSFPSFAVIPDKELELLTEMDFVEYQGKDVDDKITRKKYPIKANAFDGQGLISPKLAEKWSKELELDYTFSSAVIRAPFIKGLVVTFDLNRFATNVAKKYSFIDIYGFERDIRQVDLIISESMFKLYNAYDNTEHYIYNCKKNKLGFSIAKVNPKEEKSHSRTSYQFLQILNLNDGEIANLCSPTLDWFRNLIGWDINSMLLYATGENKFKPEDFDKLDTTVQAIMINPELAKDKYIRKKFKKSLRKKIKESYMGKLLINANYQFMISDPYAQAQHLFGIELNPLLNKGEYYSKYWTDKGVDKVGAIRSPIVHHSEFNILNFKDTQETRKWYKHLESGIVYPANGIGMDCAIHGGADFDGDLICTINNKTMINGKIPGTPIIYESKKVNKEIVDSRDDEIQVEGQLRGHNSKLGFATNISSTLYSMLNNFEPESKEYKTILNRLKIGRVIQGEIIDSVKGLEVPPFRQHWTKYKKITKDMNEEEKKKWELYNNIVCEVRPSYFRYLYPHYMTRYRNELKKYNIFSYLAFGEPFGGLWEKENKTDKEKQLLERYKSRTYFLNNNCIVNRISRYMRTNMNFIKRYSKKFVKEFDYNILIDKNIEIEEGMLFQMYVYLEEYKDFKKGMRNKNKYNYKTLDEFIKYLQGECFIDISSNASQLANVAVLATYGDEVSMVEFPWRMFPEGILQNIIGNSTGKSQFPIENENGNIEYLWNKYLTEEFELEKLYEN